MAIPSETQWVTITLKHNDMHEPAHWFAIKTRQDFRAEEILSPLCEEIFFPKEITKNAAGIRRKRAIIPHVLFVRTNERNLLALESEGRTDPGAPLSFWIYRYPKNNEIQVIPEEQIRLLRLLTANDATRCEIFRKHDFTEGQRVRVTAGPFKGYQGSVQRVKKNKHVIVKIEGICLVMLPYIHPDLLEVVQS